MTSLRFFIVGNPENRRVQMFLDALAKEQKSCCAASVYSYRDLLTRPETMNRLFSEIAQTSRFDMSGASESTLNERTTPIIRLESPGENFLVEKELIRLGYSDAQSEGTPSICSSELDRQEEDRGLIFYPGQWRCGLVRFLNQMATRAEETERATGRPIRFMNTPKDIAVMFDKRETWIRCANGGVPVPPALTNISSFDQLISEMERRDWRRVFVKLASGSSASGVGALYRPQFGRIRLITSAELVRAKGEIRLYNSLKIRTYTSTQDVADIIDALARQGVHVEKWLPKASQDGLPFDLRLVVIGGRCGHGVVRKGSSPMTNLFQLVNGGKIVS